MKGRSELDHAHGHRTPILVPHDNEHTFHHGRKPGSLEVPRFVRPFLDENLGTIARRLGLCCPVHVSSETHDYSHN